MLRVQSVRLGMDFQSNCYVISNDSGEAAAVDIGGNPDEMLKFLDKNNFSLKKILLTHGHYDHFRGVAAVAEKNWCRGLYSSGRRNYDDTFRKKPCYLCQ